jgi:hypothetical protein
MTTENAPALESISITPLALIAASRDHRLTNICPKARPANRFGLAIQEAE